MLVCTWCAYGCMSGFMSSSKLELSTLSFKLVEEEPDGNLCEWGRSIVGLECSPVTGDVCLSQTSTTLCFFPGALMWYPSFWRSVSRWGLDSIRSLSNHLFGIEPGIV